MSAQPLLLAVDGGNSKTDVVLATAAGDVLGRVRGGPFRPQVTGLDAALNALGTLIERLGCGVVAQLSAFVAGADLPVEESALNQALAARGWAERCHGANDTFAVLHAGASAGWGVAVVCGTGINCVGLDPDGRVARFPALGRISGDWGGGKDLGYAVLWQAVRAEDGRGPETVLAKLVVDYFANLPALAAEPGSVAAITQALHLGTLRESELLGLTRPLFEAASAGDAVACALLDRQAAEIGAMGMTAMRRLDLLEREVEVVLGGGLMAARHPYLSARVAEAFAAAECAALRVVDADPVVGAAMHALGCLHHDAGALRRARERLREEVAA